jgi:hypothetical protein
LVSSPYLHRIRLDGTRITHREERPASPLGRSSSRLRC